jgi:acetate---CoA ligase (ADP-forming)
MTGLEALFAPRGVAVIGASRQPGKLGAVMARSLARFGGGPLLVNARPDAGAYPSLTDAVAATGRDIDLAIVCVPAAACAEAVTDAADAGARAVLVCAGGFGEAGASGARFEDELRVAVAARGIRLLGPNTSGFVVPRRALIASFVPAAAELPAGSVAVVAASGGVNHAVAFDLASAGNGISLAVGIGAGLDVTAADVLTYLETDDATRAVGLHVETVPDGAALVSAIRRLAAIKPVVALIVGRSDIGAFAQSHTGALATSWRTTRAVLRQAGAVVVDDERELVDALTALSRVRCAPSTDPGVGVITAQAGPALLLVDQLRSAGVRVPALTADTRHALGELLPPMTYQQNPVDTGRPDATFGDVMTAVAADPAVDVLVTYALLEPDALDLPGALSDTRVPAVVATGGLADHVAEARAQLHKVGIPTLTSPSAAATAVRALIADAHNRTPRGQVVASDPVCLPAEALDEAAAKDLLEGILDGAGVTTPARRVCENRDQAHAALTELGGPVVVKLLDATVLHKSDVGGVHVGVRTPGELEAALDAIGAQRYLLEAMAPSGVDIVVGARRDPVFGPIVLLGLGGTAAEVLADIAIRSAPLSATEAASMCDELAGRALLRGYRGGPTVDERRVGHLIALLGAVVLASRDVQEIEINPLRATGEQLIALDAVVIRTDGVEHAS